MFLKSLPSFRWMLVVAGESFMFIPKQISWKLGLRPIIKASPHTHTRFRDIHTAASNLQLNLIKLLICRTNEKMNKKLRNHVVVVFHQKGEAAFLFLLPAIISQLRHSAVSSARATAPFWNRKHCVGGLSWTINNATSDQTCFHFHHQISWHNAWVTHQEDRNEKLCCETTQQLKQDARCVVFLSNYITMDLIMAARCCFFFVFFFLFAKQQCCK